MGLTKKINRSQLVPPINLWVSINPTRQINRSQYAHCQRLFYRLHTHCINCINSCFIEMGRVSCLACRRTLVLGLELVALIRLK